MKEIGKLKELPKVTLEKGWPWNHETDPSVYDVEVEWPKISIVTPSFNQGEFIEETIRSVILQNYPNLEYIVIDGNSSDNTIEILKDYDQFIDYWISEPDSGQSDAINKGLKKCTGKIFNWLNSDDLLVEGALFAIARSMIQSPEINIVYGREIHFSDNAEERKNGTLVFDNLEKTIFEGVIYQPSTFWKLEILNSIGSISNDLHYLMDAEIWTKYLLKYGQNQVLGLDKVIARFRLHESSKTVSDQIFFVKQRWSLRRAILKYLGMDYLYELCDSLSDETRLELSSENTSLDIVEMRKLFLQSMMETFYTIGDYKNTRVVLRLMRKNNVSFGNREWMYFVKVYLIPSGWLNRLRKLK